MDTLCVRLVVVVVGKGHVLTGLCISRACQLCPIVVICCLC